MSGSQAMVLVTDAQDRCALACIRSLGADGYRVAGASPTRWGAGLWSKWCSSRRILPDPRESLPAFTAGLASLLQADRPAALLACRDETVFAVSAHRDLLPAGVRVGLPDHEAVLRALDKTCLARAADGVGLAPPTQHACHSAPEALSAAGQLGYPLLVKPVATIYELDGRIDRHPSAWVPDERTLLTAQARMGSCIVQQRVDGTVLSFGGVMAGRDLIGAVLSRYLRKWPAAAGHASFTESIPISPDLLARVRSLVAAIGWTGVFELELIQRPGGEIHAIDFNPRPYGSIALARAAGAPLATLWCDWLLGRPVEPRHGRAGAHFRSEEGELHHLVHRLRGNDRRGAAAVARPVPGVVRANVQLADPLPALAYTGFLAHQKLGRTRG